MDTGALLEPLHKEDLSYRNQNNCVKKIYYLVKQAMDKKKEEKPLCSGFKIGGPVSANWFSNSVTQGPNELKDEHLITSSKNLNVISLKNCEIKIDTKERSQFGSEISIDLGEYDHKSYNFKENTKLIQNKEEINSEILEVIKEKHSETSDDRQPELGQENKLQSTPYQVSCLRELPVGVQEINELLKGKHLEPSDGR